MNSTKPVICTLVFLIKDNKILLGMKKRGLGANLWNGPGGKVEPDETIEEGMVRECQEEVSVAPTVYTKVAENDFLMDSDRENAWHMFVHVYIATEWEGNPIESPELAPQWFQLTDIPFDGMWEDDKYWLPQVLAGKLLRTRFTFDASETMLSHSVEEVEAF